MHRSFNIDEHLTEHGQPVFLFSKPSVSIHVYCSYINGETPSYLADDCQLIADSGRRCLRSADANALTVPRTNTRLGDRSFSVQTSFKDIFVWRGCSALVTLFAFNALCIN